MTLVLTPNYYALRAKLSDPDITEEELRLINERLRQAMVLVRNEQQSRNCVLGVIMGFIMGFGAIILLILILTLSL